MATRTKNYYIGLRTNPQLKSYYVAYGQLTKKDAKAKENCVYGSMSLTSYESENEYQAKIDELKENGFRVSKG